MSLTSLIKLLLIAMISVCAIAVILFIKERDDFKPSCREFIVFDEFLENNGIEYETILHKDGMAIYLDGQGNAVLVIATKKWGIDNLNNLKQ